MKRILFAAVAFASACGVAQAQKAPKVAIVNVQQVVAESTKAIDQRITLQTDAGAVQRWMQEQELSLANLRKQAEDAKVQAENALLTDAGRASARATLEARVREFQAVQEQYLRGRQEKESALNARQQKMTENLIEEVRPLIQDIAKEKGADLVLNSTPGTLNVLYADPSLDVTAEVVKRLNATYTPRPKPAPAAPAAAGAATGGTAGVATPAPGAPATPATSR